MNEQLRNIEDQTMVWKEYENRLRESWVFGFGVQPVIRFTETPEAYDASRISFEEEGDVNFDSKLWSPTVLLYLDSYTILSDYLRRKNLLAESEVLDPLPWRFDEKLIFYQKEDAILLHLNFGYEFYSDIPYFEHLLGEKVSDILEGSKNRSMLARILSGIHVTKLFKNE